MPDIGMKTIRMDSNQTANRPSVGKRSLKRLQRVFLVLALLVCLISDLSVGPQHATSQMMHAEDGKSVLGSSWGLFAAAETKLSNDHSDPDSQNPRSGKSFFETLLGDTLYTWGQTDAGDKAIYEADTAELLQGKKYIFLYFSASWCGPCKVSRAMP